MSKKVTQTIIASGPVIVENNKVLLNKHGDTDFWKFCGGKMETLNEGLFEGAQREAREKMGIEIKKLDNEPFLMFTQKETDDGVIDIILVHWLAERIGEVNPGDDIDEWAWISLDEIESYNDLGPNIIPALQHFGFLKK